MEVKQEAGYAEVRPGVHVFWLLQYTTHADGYLARPWLIWIQGGPGWSGASYANYLMFGPEHLDGQPRQTTWLQTTSILYIDFPANTGFSYLDPEIEYSTTLPDSASDLVALVREFLEAKPEFRELPLFIFGQSYGGKFAAAFAQKLSENQREGGIDCDLKVVALGNADISPLDSHESCSEMLYQMSYLDEVMHAQTLRYVEQMKEIMKRGEKSRLIELSGNILDLIPRETSYYNIFHTYDEMVETSMYATSIKRRVEIKMEEFRSQFPIIPANVTYLTFDRDTFHSINGPEGEFMRSAYHMIDSILHNSSIQVVVYSGQYDYICCTSGQQAWIRRLTWPGMQEYQEKDRETLLPPAESTDAEMYVKATDRFKFYWILHAGHVVPLDVPDVSLRMLDRILDDVDN